ncbi:hypothetical protein ACEWY4_025597 [Coilia grayii]|uniref:BESS domain-containing protein n=1 Tax=Coilia grayii TaxID=363190 RepID=A0ABD1ISG0_9TELE
MSFESCELLEEECRKKWKALRDQFRKEKNRERRAHRSGAAGGTARTWKYAAIMEFLTPFMDFRETASNYPSSQQYPCEPAEPEPCGDEWSSLPASQYTAPASPPSITAQPSPVTSTAPVSLLASPADSLATTSLLASNQPSSRPTTPAIDRPVPGRRRQRRDNFEDRLIELLERNQPPQPTPPPPEDEDELFFKSLIPALRKLPRGKREELKYAFYGMVLEAGREREGERE